MPTSARDLTFESHDLSAVLLHSDEDEPLRICSIREAAELLRRPLAQMQMMSGAHLLGRSFTTSSGTTYYLRSDIDELSRAPRLDKHDLLQVTAPEFPALPTVVLRQAAPRRQDSVERSWYGFDRLFDRSTDPAKRAAQDNATRMFWPVTLRNRQIVEQAALAGATIPLVISVGGWIASCREITGIDSTLSAAHGSQVAFTVKSPGDWASRLTDSWLNSGPGKAILWWNHERN